jgi:hypothetical protein
LYNFFSKDTNINKLAPKRILGRGAAGIVYIACDPDACLALKKNDLDKTESKYIKSPFSDQALKYSAYIEYASGLLINQLIIQRICPNFVLSYHWQIKRRHGTCDDIYPYKSLHYNEFINKSQTYSDWADTPHTLEEFDNAYFQITVGLYALQTYFNMKHLDLHSENILVKRVPPGGCWKYTINDETYYVPNLGYIFFINDYGHAWVPDNFQSWFIRQRFKKHRVHKGIDIMHLFRSTLDFSTSPKTFKSKIRKLIKDLRENADFATTIRSIWGELYSSKGKRKVIESYNLDKPLNVSSLPPRLRSIVVRKKQ